MSIDIARILRETFVDRVEHHHTVTSANDRATQCSKERTNGLPLLVVADQQTAGRGRGTNRWWSGTGSLAMSLLIDADLVGANHQRSPLVALAAAMAVVDTIFPLLPAHRVGIRWPNDVFVENRKLAGILIEVLPDRRHVVGIGINTNCTLADAPPELRTTACSIRDLLGVQQDHTDVLICLLRCLDHDFSQLRSSPTKIADRANDLCLQRNHTLTIESGGKVITGRCQGIGSEGALLIDTPVGIQRFVSGTVRQ